jgi:hypothetical protein
MDIDKTAIVGKAAPSFGRQAGTQSHNSWFKRE